MLRKKRGSKLFSCQLWASLKISLSTIRTLNGTKEITTPLTSGKATICISHFSLRTWLGRKLGQERRCAEATQCFLVKQEFYSRFSTPKANTKRQCGIQHNTELEKIAGTEPGPPTPLPRVTDSSRVPSSTYCLGIGTQRLLRDLGVLA